MRKGKGTIGLLGGLGMTALGLWMGRRGFSDQILIATTGVCGLVVLVLTFGPDIIAKWRQRGEVKRGYAPRWLKLRPASPFISRGTGTETAMSVGFRVENSSGRAAQLRFFLTDVPDVGDAKRMTLWPAASKAEVEQRKLFDVPGFPPTVYAPAGFEPGTHEAHLWFYYPGGTMPGALVIEETTSGALWSYPIIRKPIEGMAPGNVAVSFGEPRVPH